MNVPASATSPKSAGVMMRDRTAVASSEPPRVPT